MRKKPENLVDLAASTGVPPEGVELTTWLIASLPPRDLTRSAKYYVPTYDFLVRDDESGGRFIQYMRDNPMPAAELGKDIILKQQELSKTRRRLACAAITLSLFAGVTTLGYESLTHTDKSMSVTTNTADRFERSVTVAVPTSMAGGLITMMIGLSQASILARRPAKRIIKRSK